MAVIKLEPEDVLGPGELELNDGLPRVSAIKHHFVSFVEDRLRRAMRNNWNPETGWNSTMSRSK